MRLAAFKAGSTFSYAGLVTGLDPDVAWGAKSSAKASPEICGRGVWPPLDVTFAQAVDYITTGNYNIALFASAADTRDWTAQMAFDILFFNTADPDPVVITDTVLIPIIRPITPPPP